MDLDDAFMFWAVASGRIDPRAYGFDGVVIETADTETLNRWASERRHDVVAVSIAHVPNVAPDYLLLPHGGSLGRNYGPVLVAREPLAASDLRGRRVGIPGPRTTAARLLQMAVPDAVPVVVPFEATLESIDAGQVDAAVLIHEGRLVYERRGYRLVLDLGVFWHQKTGGLPLPLGGNVIRRDLGDDAIRRASRLCRDSIAYALDHRAEAIRELLAQRSGMSEQDADHYLSLYANQDTLDYGPDGRASVEALVGQPITFAP